MNERERRLRRLEAAHPKFQKCEGRFLNVLEGESEDDAMKRIRVDIPEDTLVYWIKFVDGSGKQVNFAGE